MGCQFTDTSTVEQQFFPFYGHFYGENGIFKDYARSVHKFWRFFGPGFYDFGENELFGLRFFFEIGITRMFQIEDEFFLPFYDLGELKKGSKKG